MDRKNFDGFDPNEILLQNFTIEIRNHGVRVSGDVVRPDPEDPRFPKLVGIEKVFNRKELRKTTAQKFIQELVRLLK